MTKPLISIVVNNYNYADFVARAIDSALAQADDLCEVIVVDDGSTDESRNIIDRYTGRAKVIYKENGGQASAFNTGYQAASGEIIIFLDSDDLLLPNAAEQLAKLYTSEMDWVKAVWQMKVVGPKDESRNALTPTDPPEAGDLRERMVREGPLCIRSAPTSGNAWNRQYLEKVMPIPEDDYPRGADGYLLMLAPIYGRIHRIDTPLSCYRVHGTNFLASKSEFQKMETLKQRYVHARRILQEHLEKLKIPHNSSSWHHAHWDQLDQLAKELKENIPPEEKLILVDGDALNVGTEVYGRRRYHLLEDKDVYQGPPATSEEAIRQIKRRQTEGLRYLAFVWYTFWWLEHYTELTDWLNTHGTRIVESDRVVIYKLKGDES